MLKELNITKTVISSIDTFNSVTTSTITGKGNVTTMLKDNSAKEISNDNTNFTTISLHDSSSNNNSSDPAEESNTAEEIPQTALTQEKPSTLAKEALIQCRKSARNAKKGVHFDSNLNDPRDSILQE
eukprot:6289843-Ditylum_brightwellii.AAC.1